LRLPELCGRLAVDLLQAREGAEHLGVPLGPRQAEIGDAGPVRVLLGVDASPAALMIVCARATHAAE
jgi:hypothetical protein